MIKKEECRVHACECKDCIHILYNQNASQKLMCAKHTVCVVILPVVIQFICMCVIMTVHVMHLCIMHL